MNNALNKTSNQKHILIVRILAGAPLFFFGLMHLIGAMPMKPLVEAAGLPAPELMSILAPIAQTLGGALLLAGALARLGALAAIGTMIGAIITHIKIPIDQWPTPSEADPNIIIQGQEPTFMLAIAAVIILGSAYIIAKGAGPFSLDYKVTTEPNSNT